jgi:hypothetical protein
MNTYQVDLIEIPPIATIEMENTSDVAESVSDWCDISHIIESLQDW